MPVDAVWSSDLYRTCATARAVYEPKGLELHTDPELREIHMGRWEDFPWGLVRQTEGERLTQFNHSDPMWVAPGGESLADVGERAERAIRRIAEGHPDQTVAVFSHGTAIRQFLANVKGVSPEEWHTMPHADNTSVTCLAWDGENFHVIFEGDNSHLDDSISTLAQQTWWRKGAQKKEDINLWYRPLEPASERNFYLDARRDVWVSTYGTDLPFDGPAFWEGAERAMAQDPMALVVAMAGQEPVGLLQLDPQRDREEGVGFLSLYYMTPAFRFRGLGVQLLGQAVSFYRRLGRTSLRLRCAPNGTARRFYEKQGFLKTAEGQIGPVSLDVLEKYIGYGR